jgi:lipoprotein-anchoring transpeptidase ErfK/SrfK
MPVRWKKFHAAFLLAGKYLAGAVLPMLLAAGCATDNRHKMVISVADQKMLVLRDGKPLTSYPVSTSKFGVGDRPGSYATPLGVLRVKEKIGHGLPVGAVFKSRQPTGEVLPVDAPGRDPIVTRILWLEGLDEKNRNAYRRYIYIHGTPEERNIGRPVSFGCIRMRSGDVLELFDTVGLNSKILITPNPLPPLLVASIPARNSQNLPLPR